MMSSRIRRMGLALLIAAISFSPRIPLPIVLPGRRFDLRAEDIFLVTVLFFWLLYFPQRTRIYRTPLFKPIAIYLGIVILSSTVANIAMMSFSLSPVRSPFYFLKELEYFLIFLLIANWVRTASDLRRASVLLLIVGLVNASWVGFQLVTGVRRQLLLITPELPGDVYRAPHLLESYGPGLIGEVSPLSVGGFFMLLILLTLSLTLFSERAWQRLLYMVLSVTFFIGLFFSVSRISMLVGIIGVATLVILTLQVRRKRFRVIPALSVIVLVVFLLISQGAAVSHVVGRLRLERILYSLSFRQQEIWEPLKQSSYDRFLLGFGKGAVGFVPELQTEEVHSHYWRVLLESGFFGLIAFIWLLVEIIRMSVRAHRNGTLAISKSISGATLAATIGLSIGALVQDIFVPVILNETWWVFIGLTAAAYRIEHNKLNKMYNPRC